MQKYSITLQSQSGMSLVQALVSLSIASIVMAGMISMNISQQRETRALSEKIAALDVEKLLVQTMVSSSLCHRLLVDKEYSSSNPQTFDPKLINTKEPPLIKLPGNKLVANVSSTLKNGPALFKVGEAPSPDIPSLVVESIHISDLEPNGDNLYKASLEVQFQNSRLIRSIKPARTTLLLTTEDVPKSNLKQIVGCGLDSREPVSISGLHGHIKKFTSSGSWKVPEGVTQIRVTAIGGGGSGINVFHQSEDGGDSYIEGCPVKGGGGGRGFRSNDSKAKAPGGEARGEMLQRAGASGLWWRGANLESDGVRCLSNCGMPGGAGGDGQDFPYLTNGAYGQGGDAIEVYSTAGGGGGAALVICQVTPGTQLKVTVGKGGSVSGDSKKPFPELGLLGIRPANDGVVLIEW